MDVMNQRYDRRARGASGPAWRLELARLVIERGASPSICDPLVQSYSRYLGLQSSGRQGPALAAHRYPHFHQAERLDNTPELRRQAMLLVLAAAPQAEIAQRLDLPEKTIVVWEQLFFEVRDLRPASAWLQTHVLEPERSRGNTTLVVELKLALAAGMAAIQPLLDGAAQLPVDEAERLFLQRLQLVAKFQECLEAPLESPRERLTFLKLFLAHEQHQRKLAHQEAQLAAQSAAAQREHELERQRLELKQLELQQFQQQPQPAHHPFAARPGAPAKPAERMAQAGPADSNEAVPGRTARDPSAGSSAPRKSAQAPRVRSA